MNKWRIIYTCLLVCVLAVLFFSFDDDKHNITAKNIQLIIPSYFPKPVYDFKKNPITPEGFMLGRKLFYDPYLSSDSTISCATCHQQFAAFAHIDHKLSHGINNRIGTRNVPPLQNLIWKDNFMWDGGVNHLELQPINPITSKDEMDERLDNIVLKLQRHPTYKLLFKKAFNDTLVTTERIFKSLAQFTGLMISSNSKYDMVMRKQETFNDAEQRGFDLFNAKCNACHKAPLFTNNAFEKNGLPIDTVLNDKGRARVTEDNDDNYKFKVPSLRNIKVTFPYMHDGRFRNLEQVLAHYNTLSHEAKIENKKLRQVGALSQSEQADLIQFLGTLTDRPFLFDRRFNLDN